MVTLVIYYSFSGRTHYEAKRLAELVGGELYEVREQKHRSQLSAYLFGAPQARRRATVILEPIAVRMEDYDRIIIMCPIWGGWPAPAFNSVIKELPLGTNVDIYLTSDSGKARDLDAVKQGVELRGAHVGQIGVIKTVDLHKRDKRHAQRRMREIQAEEQAKQAAEQTAKKQ